MSVHRIHLRGPWKLESSSQGVASARKIRLPADWNDLFSGCRDSVRLTRTFHQPTNLGADDEVDLVFERWPGIWTVTLNRRPLGQFQDASVESPKRMTITPFLQPMNVLAVDTRFEQPIDQNTRRGVIGDIALEIRGD